MEINWFLFITDGTVVLDDSFDASYDELFEKKHFFPNPKFLFLINCLTSFIIFPSDFYKVYLIFFMCIQFINL